MRRLYLVIALPVALSVMSASSFAQPPHAEWTQTYGGNSDDEGYSVVQTTEGEYVIAGYTRSQGAGNSDIYLIKTDSQGNLIWERTFGGSNDDFGYCLQQTTDGGYIIVGSTASYGAGGTDVYLIKTDADGNQVWQQTLGGEHNDVGYSIEQTTDGGYIIAGTTYYLSYWNPDVYVIKTDNSGNRIWHNIYGGDGSDQGKSVQQTRDGGYIIAGCSTSVSGNHYEVYLVKIDSVGNQIWQHTYHEHNDDRANSVRQTSDGGYIMVGKTGWSPNFDVYLIKTDGSGNELWSRIFGDPLGADEGFCVRQTTDGGYIITGTITGEGIGERDVYLIKTDSIGYQVWQRNFGGDWGDYGRSVLQTPDGGYIVAGSLGGNRFNVYLIKTDSGGDPLDLTASLNPLGMPIVIPANGGSFDFNPLIINNGPSQAPFIVWGRIRNPNGTYTYPTLGPITLSLPAGMTITAQRTQNIPATWPAGQYSYLGYAGWVVSYPAAVTDSFPFTKSTVADGNPWVTDSSCTGESFPGEAIPLLSRGDRGDLAAASPNPFNPTTAINYQLQATSQVKLTVWDIAGRLVATLVDGMQAAGQHSVSFDGSKLTSGLYLYRLQAGQNTATGKMVLLK